MQVDNLITYLSRPNKIAVVSENEIKPLLDEFPYCQTGQLMYAINLNSNNSILFENQIKKAASICADRTKLFEHIHQNIDNTIDEKEVEHIEQTELVDDKFAPSEGKDELSILEKEYLSQAISSSIMLESDNAIEEINILEEEPEEVNLFDEEATHSFSSWLKHYSGEDVYEEKEITKRERNQDIIDKFIQEDPKIEPKKTEFYSPTNMARLSVKDEGIVSETLALIHVDQGNYQEAINTYEKLSLKNPKKSSYFAAQIKILKQKLK